MQEGPVSPCGHDNPPSAHFCDVCGARLPTQCPRCSAINRRHANFCANCGVDLRDVGPTHVTSAVAPIGPPLLTSPVNETEAAPIEPGPVSIAPVVPPTLAASKRVDVEDAQRLDRIRRFFARQQRPRRPPAWLGIAAASAVASIMIGVLGVILVRTYVATPRATPPSVLDRRAQARIPPLPDDAASSAIAHSAVTSGSPSGATGRPAHNEGSPAPAAQDASSAAAASPARAGGGLIFVVPGEPPSYDAHREETFALIHPAAPHYNTLLRIDPSDPTGTRVVGDLATSWTVSSDKRTYVLRLRRGVKFHDGSEMTSRDVRATYEKIINPPPGITSARRGEYLQIETVQAPEPYIVAFKLRWPSPSFIHSLASPWNWIYKADILERDVRWYEKNIMGTGPFIFVEHVKGSRWVGRRNPNYWDRGKPYLDGYQALFIRDDVAQASAIRTRRAHIQFRGFSPAQRDDLVSALGDKITVQTSPWNCVLLVAINHDKPPFHDARVRRALSLALDRYAAAGALSKTAIVRDVAGVQVPGSPFATPPAELVKLAGYGRDIRESRSEARRLLAEAGVPEGFSFVLKNRDIPMPYEQIGEWLVDEWQRIGLTAHHEIQESGQYFRDLRAGNFELSTDFQCGYVVDPDLDLYKFQSRGRSDANYGRYADPVLDELYVRQSRAVDPEQRRKYIRAFEKRLVDEEAHYIYTLQWHRIVPHSARVRGWMITPSHYLNNQLDTVWLAE
jgi:peptide/nickel transport system substrate-binding protein